jgi:hypothetical protein
VGRLPHHGDPTASLIDVTVEAPSPRARAQVGRDEAAAAGVGAEPRAR